MWSWHERSTFCAKVIKREIVIVMFESIIAESPLLFAFASHCLADFLRLWCVTPSTTCGCL